MMSNKIIEVKREDGSIVKVYVSRPSAQAIRKATLYTGLKYGMSILDEGIKTKEELAVVMEKKRNLG